MADFLPVSPSDMRRRGWDQLDVILITGDAYVDHPAYGVALIGRVLASHGYRVGVIAQPDWRTAADFKRLGRPRLFFGITSGNVDSMVANYTANKRPRKKDDYTPGGKPGRRPDRALIVYANRVRQAFKDVGVVIGGIEASMRRLAHYDYWDNRVRRSILFDARADMLVYGMGESQTVEIARRLSAGETIDALDHIPGTAVIRKDPAFLDEFVTIPAYEAVIDSHRQFNRAFALFYREQNPVTARPVVQAHGDRWAVVYPPPMPLSQAELDAIYELDYQRVWHPEADAAGGVKGLETVRHSLITHRGCSGECNFCSLYFHQGRMVQSRSADSIVREATRLTRDPAFHGTITDMGGPTANLYGADCPRWAKKGFCRNKRCMAPEVCPSLDPGYGKSLPLYRRIRSIPGVKHAFIGSGFRHDLFGGSGADACLEELCRFHVSGRMKVAPEHICEPVLDAMGKPPIAVYDAFVGQFKRIGNQPSLAALPGQLLHQRAPRFNPERCPGDGRLSDPAGDAPRTGTGFHSLAPDGLRGHVSHGNETPITGKRIHVAKTFRERKMQRALIQYRNPSNRQLIRDALKELKSEHLASLFFKAAGGKAPKRSAGAGGRHALKTGKKSVPMKQSGGRRAGKTGTTTRRRRRR
jgi:uncharacterized radical SAM protein YgiQ